MKKAPVALIAILIMGLFATGSVLSADLETLDGADDEMPVDAIEEELKKASVAKEIGLNGSTRAYYGHGWATSGDNGYVIQAVWLRNNVDNLHELSAEEKHDVMMGGGILRLGTGSNAEIFELTKTTSPTDHIVFTIDSMEDSNVDEPTNDNMLIIERSPYSGVSTWEGVLILEDTKYEVKIGTRSVEVDDMHRIKKLIMAQNKRNFMNTEHFRKMLRKMTRLFN